LVYGVASLPLGTPVELEAVFEIEGYRLRHNMAEDLRGLAK